MFAGFFFQLLNTFILNDFYVIIFVLNNCNNNYAIIFLFLLEYDMCELTLTAPSFLWHQIRYITSVLFLVGQKKEEPSVITKLVDIDTYPK